MVGVPPLPIQCTWPPRNVPPKTTCKLQEDIYLYIKNLCCVLNNRIYILKAKRHAPRVVFKQYFQACSSSFHLLSLRSKIISLNPNARAQAGGACAVGVQGASPTPAVVSLCMLASSRYCGTARQSHGQHLFGRPSPRKTRRRSRRAVQKSSLVLLLANKPSLCRRLRLLLRRW